MSKVYYHITENENVESILKNGLKCDEFGYTYLITENRIQERMFGSYVYIPDVISYDQLGMESYSLLKIDSRGFSTDIENDDVGEYVSRYQKRIKQTIIDKKYIEVFLKKRDVNFDQLKKYKYSQLCSFQLGSNLDSKLEDLWRCGSLPLRFTNEMENKMNSLFQYV